MIAILGALLGFAGPFLPEVLKFLTRAQDNKHELALFELRMKAGAQEHLWRLEELNARADIEEVKEIHKPQVSFGTQMLDAAVKTGWGWWATVPAFYLMVLVDFFSGMLRSVVTYAFAGGYLAYKLAQFKMMESVSDASFQWYEGVLKLWTPDDYALLLYVLTFWFGQRAAKAAFGGQARNAKPGA